MIAIARSLLTAVIIGIMAVVSSISFAAIVYSGELAPFLGRGIGLTLAGATIMALVGSFCLSYPGTIVQPQDVTALILSLAVASIAHGWAGQKPNGLFATVAVLVAVTTAITGAVIFLFGRLNLGFIVRFIPYPVLGGFLVATGYLLTTVAIGMTLGQNVSLWSWTILFAPGNPEKWIPWLVAGVLFCVASKRIQHGLVIPACVVIATAGFYLTLWLTGASIQEAQARGFLLGPFDKAGLYADLGPWILTEAKWSVVALQFPSMIAVISMAIVGLLLNVSGLELSMGLELDPNRELRGAGIANLVSSLGGGMVGYHVLSKTLFARALGLTGHMAGIAVALISAMTLVAGASYLSVLPIGVFAAMIAFLGIDLLFTWLWQERRRLPARDVAIVLLILAVAATVGFLQAIAVGLLAASMQFIIGYAGIDVVRLRTTAATMRSRVERSQPEMRLLSQHGGRAVVYALSGYLFFGTANRLLAEVVSIAASGERRPAFILIDFRRVQGIDASAAFALVKLHRTCAANGVELIFSGLSTKLQGLLNRSMIFSAEGQPRQVGQLDEALQIVEERLLLETAGAADGFADMGFLETLRKMHPDVDLTSNFEELIAKAGELVIEQGAQTDSIVVLQEGSLRVEYVHPHGAVTPVARMLPGALIGEIGLYAGVPRTARVIAVQDCRLLRISTSALAQLTHDEPGLVADIHRLAASYLARRLIRTESLLRDADV
jgi:sulfate permease, SulP family